MDLAAHAITPVQSKYAQVRSMLLAQIRQGSIRTGQRIPSEPSLCRHLGVSRDTVRKAIGELVRDGVLQTRQGVGHVVCATQPTTTIALVWNFPIFSARTAPSHLLLFRALREQLNRRRCKVRLHLPPAHEHRQTLLEYDRLSRDIRRGRFAGLIGAFWPSPTSAGRRIVARDRQIIDELAQAKIPCVNLQTSDTPNTVGTDYRALGEMPTQYLLDQGLRRVAIFCNDDLWPPFIPGWRKAYHDHGLTPDESLKVECELAADRSGYDAFMRLWSQPNRPEAIIVPDDLVTRGVMLAAMELGVRIPDDLQVATLTVKDSNVFYPRPVIRLEFDQAQRARTAIDLLLARLKDPALEAAPSLMKPQLVDEVREHVA